MPHLSKLEDKIVRAQQIVGFSPTLDGFRRYVTDNPSPEKFATLLRQVDSGDVAALTELQIEMEAKSPVFQGIADTRRAALTGTPWDVEPNPMLEGDSTAAAVANYVKNILRGLTTWPDTLKFIASAIGPNVAVVELVWRRSELVKTNDVASHRLQLDPVGQSNVLYVETEEVPQGIPVDIAPHKFAVFNPDKRAGFPYYRTITHASVWPYMVCHFGSTDWMSFSELYGTPMRVAKYSEGATPATKNAVEDMLRNMGPGAAGHFPEDVVIELLQASGTGETFEKQLSWAEKTIAILWQGQTLTTDVGDRGSFAAAQIHANIRGDILTSDAENEARFIREQIIRPMVRMRFPNIDAPVPVFVRKFQEAKDIESDRLAMDQVKLAQELGLPMDTAEIYDRLKLTKPVKFDAKTIGGPVEPTGGTDDVE